VAHSPQLEPLAIRSVITIDTVSFYAG